MWKGPLPPLLRQLSRSLCAKFFFLFWFAAISCLALPQRWSEKPFLTTIKSTRLLRPPWALLLFPSSPPQSKKGRRVSSADGGRIAALGAVLLNSGWSLMDHPTFLPLMPSVRVLYPGFLLVWKVIGEGVLIMVNIFPNPLKEFPLHSSTLHFSICYPTHHPLNDPNSFIPKNKSKPRFLSCFCSPLLFEKKRRKKRPSFESSATIIREGGVGGEKSRIKLWVCSSWLEKERCLPTYRHHDLICRRRYDDLL